MTSICEKPTVYSKFRLISKLPFLSKILGGGEIESIHLQNYASINCISDIFQSDFNTLHSTESDLLKVFNDILIMTDAGNMMALVLLDLCSSFDFVDHNILLHQS